MAPAIGEDGEYAGFTKFPNASSVVFALKAPRIPAAFTEGFAYMIYPSLTEEKQNTALNAAIAKAAAVFLIIFVFFLA